MPIEIEKQKQILEFLQELEGFAIKAEATLKQIEENMEANKGLFKVFSNILFTIRGTALQLDLPQVAHIAGFSEEIAIKAETATTRPQIRKCIGSLWDAMTSVKHLILNKESDTSEEQSILINRLQYTLDALGGARPTFSSDEIMALLQKNQKS
jgi:hypothetical protein